jgi:replicative DNA helicase
VNMSSDEAEHLRVRCAELAASGLLIDDTPAISIGELRAKVAKAVAEHGVRIVYVDYLQLMAGDQKGNREQEIGSISRGLKLIAKENNVPVIALAQLSRAVETRGGDKKPQLNDLRESGSIEQDADLVIFLYRAEYYKITEDDMGNPTAGLTEVLIEKHRNGATMGVVVQSDMRTGRYSDLAADAPFVVPENRPGTFPTSNFDQAPY